MKAFFVENGSECAIIIPETRQFWVDPSIEDLRLFASSSPNFPEWEGAYEDSLVAVEPSLESVSQYWVLSTDDIVIAESDDGNVIYHNRDLWQRHVGC